MQKAAAYKVQGMHRDSSPTNFNPEKAFEIVNMRLITDEEGSAFSLVNEKGTTYKCVLDHNELLTKIWTPIGQCATTDSLIVFATCTQAAGQSEDAIFRVKIDTEDNITSHILYRGHLGFQADKPIETLFNYEAEDIQKVYWIDGVNQLRCINIAEWNEDGQSSITHIDTSFDSALPLSSNSINVSIDRLSGGSFKAGVIQYYATYFNKYKTESAIIWQSPLLYLANSERGAEVSSSVDTAFKFTFTGLDSTNWGFIRVYSVYRGSIDTEPSANIVQELSIKGISNVEVFDYGTSNTAISASDLYFVGSKFVKAGTMTVKDQVLFLGNLSTRTPLTPPEGIDLSESLIVNDCKEVDFKISETEGTYYKYDNQLDNTAPISTYKNGETYRFGYQLQDEFGAWGDPVWIKDATIDFAPKMNYDNNQEKLQLAQPYLVLPEEVINTFKQNKAIAIRPLIVYPDVKDRSILCQGVVCPTVYNLKDRKDNSPYAQASWFMRPNIPGDIWWGREYQEPPSTGHMIDNNNNPSYDGLLNNMLIGVDQVHSDKFNLTRASILLDEVPHSDTVNNIFTDVKNKDIVTKGSWAEFRHNYALKTKGYSYGTAITTDIAGYPGLNKDGSDPDRTKVINTKKEGDSLSSSVPSEAKGDSYVGILIHKYYGLARGAEIDSTRGIATIPVNRFLKDTDATLFNGVDIKRYNTGSSAYYVDSSIVTVNSPELELVDDLYTIPTNNYKFRIVGMIPLTANVSDISLETENPSLYSHDQPTDTPLGLNKLNIHTENIGYTGFRSLIAATPYLAWFHLKAKNEDKQGDIENTISSWGNTLAGHLLYPWQSTGNIQTFMASDTRRSSYSKLKRKVLSNARFSAVSYYLPEESWWSPSYEDSVSILPWTSTDNSIQKFQINENLKLPDVVYKGNIDSLAMQDVNGSSYDLYYYTGLTSFQGDNKKDIVAVGESTFYQPTFTTNSEIVQKGQSIASSIKYKSSPHYAVFLGGKHLSTVGKTVLEVLPSLGTNRIEYKYEIAYDPSLYMYAGNAWKEGIQYFWVAQMEDTSRISIDTDNYKFTANVTTSELESTTEDGYSLPGRSRVNISLDLGYSSYKYIVQALNTLGNFSQTKSFDKSDKATYKYLDPDTSEDISENLKLDSYTITSIYQEEYNRVYVSIELKSEAEMSEDEEYHTISFYSYRRQTSEEGVRLNQVGITEKILEQYVVTRNNTLDFGRVYESADVASLALQKSVTLGKTSLNLPSKYVPQPSDVTYNPINYGWLWLGEIYKETPPTFGGTSEYALLNNKWEVAGESISLSSPSPVLKWSIGDTYYQRFDTLKTYAYSDADENSVIDITSFMVETHLNIDGRYDRNRGQESNLNMSPKNFNLFNKVYTQRDNFFTYSKIDKDVGKRTSFPNQITWSLVKTAGESLDQWMNITLTSILDLDGRKGNLSALKTFQNEVIAFQDKGIANVIYNPRTQISSTDGTPIYIANSAKVEGTRYITEALGCQDKWSIVTSPNGLYFIDFYNKSVYKFNGQIEDVANAQGFHTWCIQNLHKNSQVLGYYDQKNKDVYFINTDWQYPCLAFNEFTNSFSSFYSYKDARLSYIQDKGLWVTNNGKIYTHQTGDYNTFFDNLGEDYHVTVVCNQDGNLSKIFNNIEFRADSWEGNTAIADKSIDYLAIETEYQKKTEETLTFKKHGISNLKKKFNVWRANIPREQGTRNRFRDVWAKVTLGGRGNARKTRLNDIVVYYT